MDGLDLKVKKFLMKRYIHKQSNIFINRITTFFYDLRCSIIKGSVY